VTEQLSLFGDLPAVEPAQNSPLASPDIAETLERWPNLYLGTSSWSFPGWKDLVYARDYDKSTLARSGLRAYSQVPIFRTVSLDRTYYRPMETRGYARLRDQVSEDFRFVVKAPRALLEVGALGLDIKAFEGEFLRPLREGLKQNLGVVLLQFPPGTLAEVGPGFTQALGRFLKALPQDIAYSLEVRDEALLDASLQEAIQGTSVALCASIHPALPTPEQQLLRVSPTPGTPLVFRWNLRPSLSYSEALDHYQPFAALVAEDVARRGALARLVARALEAGRVVYMTVNNKAEGCAPLSLAKFAKELNSQKP